MFGAWISSAIRGIGEHWQLVLIAALLACLILQPLGNFLLYGWSRKAEEINSSLRTEAKKTYLSVFWDRTVELPKVESEFSELYYTWYGRRRFLIPLLLIFCVVVAVTLFLGSELVEIANGRSQKFSAACAAVAGAYTFVAWDFLGRAQRRNVTTSAIMRGALRLSMAVPVGFAFAAVVSADLGLFISFAVGVFPLETISTILRRLVNDKLKIELGANSAPDQVATLSGIDRSIADRIEDADITTIPQLAWCDPILLTMRTNLSFDYVVDIVGQALAWVYLGEKLQILRMFGLRSAYEIKVFMDELEGSDKNLKSNASKVLIAASLASQIPEEGLKYAFEQIAGDKATQFLYEAS
ncbi:hypothetical protein [Tardiphaga robiniae]|uniref:Uncharacterized protein n=1 Tax=Tardiphaga robiniae TaxID=943830 RepID=A0A161QTA3_9BRAD|nr:hypothetical protein [Tardiphaga robiniae]KZD24714.1 hypothetical protein A4A58_20395 [Tardiphaga robiniae]